MTLTLLNALTQEGYRIFSVDNAKKLGQKIGLKESTVPRMIKALSQEGLIRHLMRGSYAIEDNILSGPPLHQFEIAMHLAKEGAICCWSAMSHHELTDQVLSTVFILVPYEPRKARSLYRHHIDGYDYVLIQTKKEHFWGTERQSLGEVKIRVTDLERTLIDGLLRPQYCGGFREVMDAFSVAKDRINIPVIVDYSRRCHVSVQKRLGWILSQLSVKSIPLVVDSGSFDKLDPSGPRRGKQNKQWMVWENF